MKTMQEVLAEHRIDHRYDTTLHEQCICGRRWMMGPQALQAHQAAALSAAGFGLVADAKAEAWDEGYEGAVDAYDGRNVSNPYRKASNDDQ